MGYIRKFSDKLQIELLHAYKPDRFKTPGTQVNIGTKGDVFVLTEEQRHELMEINRQFLPTAPLPESQLGTVESQQLTSNTPALPAHGASAAG